MAYTGTDSTQRTQAGATSFTNNVFGVATSTTGGVATYFTYNPDGSLSSILLSGHRYYAYGDGAGSVAGLIDSSGAQVATYSYDPYGNTTSTGPQAAINPFRFKGGYLDTTNYYKFGTRFYDAILGSWTQQDANAGSVQNPAAVNRYPYAGDDPVNNADPSGMCFLGFGSGCPISNYLNTEGAFLKSILESNALKCGASGIAAGEAALGSSLGAGIAAVTGSSLENGELAAGVLGGGGGCVGSQLGGGLRF
jgi:RHS repeat-associated protein